MQLFQPVDDDSKSMTHAEAVVNMFAKSYGGKRNHSNESTNTNVEQSNNHNGELTSVFTTTYKAIDCSMTAVLCLR